MALYFRSDTPKMSLNRHKTHVFLWYIRNMKEAQPTLPEAIGAFIKTAYAARHYTGAHGYNCTMPMTCDEQTLTLKKWPNFMEDFEHDLGRIQEEFADIGITLNPIADEDETVTKSRFRQFFSLKADPEKPNVSFSIACENPAAAITALIQKTEEMQKIALETQAKEIVQSIANCIPKDMSPELAAQVLEGFFTLGVETAQKHKIPVPSVATGELSRATMETKEPSVSLN